MLEEVLKIQYLMHFPIEALLFDVEGVVPLDFS